MFQLSWHRQKCFNLFQLFLTHFEGNLLMWVNLEWILKQFMCVAHRNNKSNYSTRVFFLLLRFIHAPSFLDTSRPPTTLTIKNRNNRASDNWMRAHIAYQMILISRQLRFIMYWKIIHDIFETLKKVMLMWHARNN